MSIGLWKMSNAKKDFIKYIETLLKLSNVNQDRPIFTYTTQSEKQTFKIWNKIPKK